ncbi:MAG: ABC transporter permease [Dehalococcoidia bacterium]|nr:MAG: ABC transporter permease [Dehalococcoidia bacterium]
MATIAAEHVSLGGRPERTRWQKTVRLARRNPLGAGAAIMLTVFSLIALGAGLDTLPVGSSQGKASPLIATHDPFRMSSDEVLQRPGKGHLLGTDDLGRDLFSRIVYGARISLWVGFISVGISVGVGAPAGMISAYGGKWIDFAIQRIVDAMFAFPTIILALAIVSVLGKGIVQTTIAVGIVGIPRIARVTRASTLGVKSLPYIEAARSLGAPGPLIVSRHVFPNILAPLIVLGTAGFGTAILAEASLSFLGLGTPPPNPSWGTMLSGAAQQYVRSAPYLAIFPGIAISLGVFGFNLFGDALRDIFDPRLRGA